MLTVFLALRLKSGRCGDNDLFKLNSWICDLLMLGEKCYLYSQMAQGQIQPIHMPLSRPLNASKIRTWPSHLINCKWMQTFIFCVQLCILKAQNEPSTGQSIHPWSHSEDIWHNPRQVFVNPKDHIRPLRLQSEWQQWDFVVYLGP